MEYIKVMEILSQCGLGALLISKDGKILSVNETGDCLLHGDGELEGKQLIDVSEQLLVESDKPIYANTAFGEYLIRCSSPTLHLPTDTQLIVFRNATSDVCHDMLMNIINQINESVVLCDEKGRIYLLNDAAVKMDSIVTQDVLGDSVSNVYRMFDGSDLAIPKAIEDKQPKLNHHQYYTTCYGREVDVVTNTYPITQNGQTLGAFNIMEDCSAINHLHNKIVDLQDKLVEKPAKTKQKPKSSLTAKYTFRDIIHTSESMINVIARCKQVAKSDSSVMIYGETGTGKELFAQSIHNASSRANGPFLAINCAAIPDSLLEGLLFGTENGAYTGAESRAGLFEQANTGTLLLDEINSMNINLQSKLLRVLQDGIVRRVGGSSEIHVDVRVLSNINIPPYQAIEENKLRRDLFYRLGVVNINVPPLRERKEDIPLLAKSFIIKYNKKLVKNVRNVDKATLEKFYNYSWLGNVRELQHAIEHAMNILPDDVSMISPDYIPEHILVKINSSNSVSAPEATVQMQTIDGSLNSTIHEIEYRKICQALLDTKGNISESARMLKMSRQNLQYRIKKYKIDINNILNKKITIL